MGYPQKFIDRFWSKVAIRAPDECWEWQAFRVKGYGRIGLPGAGQNGKKGRSHMVAYEIEVGPIPDGMYVLHSCNNPPCCNPKHLRVGTQSENMLDAVYAGTHNRTILTVERVLEMRARFAAGETTTSVAALYGVAFETAKQIRQRRSWKNI